MNNQLETIQDGALEDVTGGLSFSLNLDAETGITAGINDLEINIPSPLTIANEVIGAAETTVKKLLNSVGAVFTKLGQLFNFS
jgi:hypothetical protein